MTQTTTVKHIVLWAALKCNS